MSSPNSSDAMDYEAENRREVANDDEAGPAEAANTFDNDSAEESDEESDEEVDVEDRENGHDRRNDDVDSDQDSPIVTAREKPPKLEKDFIEEEKSQKSALRLQTRPSRPPGRRNGRRHRSLLRCRSRHPRTGRLIAILLSWQGESLIWVREDGVQFWVAKGIRALLRGSREIGSQERKRIEGIIDYLVEHCITIAGKMIILDTMATKREPSRGVLAKCRPAACDRKEGGTYIGAFDDAVTPLPDSTPPNDLLPFDTHPTPPSPNPTPDNSSNSMVDSPSALSETASPPRPLADDQSMDLDAASDESSRSDPLLASDPIPVYNGLAAPLKPVQLPQRNLKASVD